MAASIDRPRSFEIARSATPIAELASSTSPIACARRWSLAIRDPSARPVSPASPVRV
jgi:hypothetical protein